jgi:hypothetical protein
MKNTYIKLMALLFVASASVSCVNDDETFGINANKSTASTSVTSLTIVEGESAVIPFTISKAITKPSQFKIELMSGNGGQDDITAGGSDTDADTGIPHVGFEITVPAYAESFDIPVNAILDSECEVNETIKLRISAAGNRTIVTPTSDGFFVDLTIPNVPTWTIDGVDTYGDGWNGASIDVTVNGTTTSYAVHDAVETFVVAIPVGASYSFEFVSGDWDGEIEYTITNGSGTVVVSETGGYPAVGVSVSGTGTACN